MKNTKTRKIIVGDFHQETNSFCSVNWTMDHFLQDTFLEGEAIVDQYSAPSGRVLSGILSEIKRQGAVAIPGCAMRATSGGRVAREAVDYYLHAMLQCIRENPDADALILSFHGATQAVDEDDVCGGILQAFREAIGPRAVIAMGCDLHANITQRCLQAADYICGFQTYPHVDQFQTGVRAARLAFSHMNGEAAMYRASITLPMILPACGYSTMRGKFAEIMDKAREMVNDGRLKDFSLFQMQPWLDVNPAGSTVLTFSESRAQAGESALALAQLLYDNRESFKAHLTSVEEIIAKAAVTPPGSPVILVDFADSPGGGSVGDSVYAVECLKRAGYPVKAATIVSDAAAVEKAYQLGAGQTGIFDLGGAQTLGALRMRDVPATIVRLQEGAFVQEGPVGKGQPRNLGRSAVLRVENIDILVCEHACGTGDVQVYRAFGIEPTEYQLLVVKANTSFRAGYESFAGDICLADTPGTGTANLKDLPYQRLPRTFYPFAASVPDAIDDPVIRQL